MKGEHTCSRARARPFYRRASGGYCWPVQICNGCPAPLGAPLSLSCSDPSVRTPSRVCAWSRAVLLVCDAALCHAQRTLSLAHACVLIHPPHVASPSVFRRSLSRPASPVRLPATGLVFRPRSIRSVCAGNAHGRREGGSHTSMSVPSCAIRRRRSSQPPHPPPSHCTPPRPQRIYLPCC